MFNEYIARILQSYSADELQSVMQEAQEQLLNKASREEV